MHTSASTLFVNSRDDGIVAVVAQTDWLWLVARLDKVSMLAISAQVKIGVSFGEQMVFHSRISANPALL